MATVRLDPYSYVGGLLEGTPEDDELYGAKGSDTLRASAGNDLLIGRNPEYGRDHDVADYRHWPHALMVDLASGVLLSAGKQDRLALIENLLAGAGNDTVLASGASATIDGGPGDDRLTAAIAGSTGGYDYTLIGGSGNDSLAGRNARESLAGGPGDDTLDGGPGNDTLLAGQGDDVLRGGSGSDWLRLDVFDTPILQIDGGRGSDELDLLSVREGSALVLPLRIDLVTGRIVDAAGRPLAELQSIEHGSVATGITSELRGDAGHNQLMGSTIFGGDGNDALRYGALMYGEAGNDHLSPGRTTLADGGAGIDVVFLPGRAADYARQPIDAAAGHFRLVSNDDGLVTELRGVERLVFHADGRCLAFGPEALAVARLAFVLLGPTAATADATLLGRLLDASDRGATMDELVGIALRAIGRPGDAALAARLAQGVDTGRSTADVLAELQGAQRATVIAALADHPATHAAVLAAGLARDGVVCALEARGDDGYLRSLFGTGFTGAQVQSGTMAPDRLQGSAGDDGLYGSKGADTFVASAGNDTIDGSFGGNDEVTGAGDDRDVADYRAVAEPIVADLALGEVLIGDTEADLLFQIEDFLSGSGDDLLVAGPGTRRFSVSASSPPIPMRLDGGPGNDTLLGSEASDRLAGGSGVNRIDARGGDDWIDLAPDAFDHVQGGPGIDTVRVPAPRADVQLFGHDSGPDGASGGPQQAYWFSGGFVLRFHTLAGVERLHFDDGVLAWGSRALEVAKVAFALWSPAIAGSPTLLGKGIDWYDQGASSDELLGYALSFFATTSDERLAQQLAQNGGGQRSAAELLSLMGQQGRAAALRAVAEGPGVGAAVEAAGFVVNGVPGALLWGAEVLFTPPG